MADRTDSTKPTGTKVVEVTFTPDPANPTERTAADRGHSRGTSSDFGHYQALSQGGASGTGNGSLQEPRTNQHGSWRQQELAVEAAIAEGHVVSSVRVTDVTLPGTTLPAYRTYQPTVDGQTQNQNVAFANFSRDVLDERRELRAAPPPPPPPAPPSPVQTTVSYDSVRAESAICNYGKLPGGSCV